MGPESRIQFQEIDCNCNDCTYMIRNLRKLDEAKQDARDYAASSIKRIRAKRLDEANDSLERGNVRSYEGILLERRSVSVKSNYRSGLSFGDCTKFNKPVSFIPNILQLDTQECFEHRR